jgi:hypothetical protein
MPPSLGSISGKSSTKAPITILPMFLAGRFSHKNEDVFSGFEGVFMVFFLFLGSSI